MMEGALLLSLSPELRIDQITATGTLLLIHVVSTQPACLCPLCGHASEQVHSHYRRTIADVPCGGKPVRLDLEVRKFFCRTPTCPRRIFTERLPELVEPWARTTKRLQVALQALGVTTGAAVGSRLAPQLGMEVRSTTLLRSLRTISISVAQTVQVLGLDDWAFKRGQIYGTILVDLERHRVIDLLPDRRAETVKAWLKAHPEIKVISRDRAGYYADAARQGAPQALQVADRFHLVKNMREKLQALLDRRHSCLPFVEEGRSSAEQEGDQQGQNTPQQDSQRPAAHPAEERPAGHLTTREQQRTRNREKRYALYESVKGLRRQGLSHYAIADHLGISRPTVRRFLAAEHFPERLPARQARRTSIVAPYLPFLRERWQAGCHNGRQLFRIICASCNPTNWTVGDVEVAGRWNDYFELPPYRGERLCDLLTFIETLLPFTQESNLALPQVRSGAKMMDGPAKLIEEWTGGILRDIMILVRDASQQAIEGDLPYLSPQLLKKTWKGIQEKRVTDFSQEANEQEEDE